MNQKEAEKILATRYSPRALITVKLMTDNPHRGNVLC